MRALLFLLLPALIDTFMLRALAPLLSSTRRSNPRLSRLLSAVSDSTPSAPLYSPSVPHIPNQSTDLITSSNPVEWRPSDPLYWCRTFGNRNETTSPRNHHLSPSDPEYIQVADIGSPGVTVVTTKEQAEVVLKALYSDQSRKAFHACDTEVMRIELKDVGPVGNGHMTCFSMYSGPDFDYGFGKGQSLFVDCLDASRDLLPMFKDWFEDEDFKKVWHNYGFDRHIMFNEEIDCKGFAGDTMHMARLEDSSRGKFGGGGGGYSLAALTEDLLGRAKIPMKEIFGRARLKKDGTPGAIIELPPIESLQRTREHRENFIKYAAYDAEGTWLVREQLQRKLQKMPWIHDHNQYDLYEMHLVPFGECLTDMERRGVRVDASVYLRDIEVRAKKDKVDNSLIFRSWAASMIGPDGLALNPNSATQLATFLFGGSKNPKTKEETETTRVFKVPRADIPEEAHQAYAEAAAKLVEGRKKLGIAEEEADLLSEQTAPELKKLCKENKLKLTGKKADLVERLTEFYMNGGQEVVAVVEDDYATMTLQDLKDTCAVRGLPSVGTQQELIKHLRHDAFLAQELTSAAKPASHTEYNSVTEALLAARKDSSLLDEMLNALSKKKTQSKFVDVTVQSLYMTPDKFTTGGSPSCTADVLKKLAGDDPNHKDRPVYGTAYDFFGGGKQVDEDGNPCDPHGPGHDACVALYSLTQMGTIDTMISSFIIPLQYLADDQSRVHCSLNMNTETGRLSARKPNLQNQPALEKDQYKIRKAFQASPGNQLIVADYGQLELRLLASMTDCRSMIDAFIEGGDFHSRTAMGMFDYIKEAEEKGEVLLEWDKSKGKAPAPMLKDEYASERRKAKTLNFSIAYGKTAHGLSKDWNVSVEEAEEMLQKWYADRPEVLDWQKETKRTAREKGITKTLMGRYRMLPEARGQDRKLIGHAERASINTPIQGGAADVAMLAMIKINTDKRLKELGWILLLQVHDEVMLEGPEETAEDAYKIVTDIMQAPWDIGLPKTLVELLVDGSFERTWYDAK